MECRAQAAQPGASPAQLLAQLHSEQHFTGPAFALAQRAAARGARVHVYQFDWAPPGSRVGAGHCIDLAFTFGTWPGCIEAPMLAGGDPAVMAAVSASLRRAVATSVASGEPRTSAAADWPPYMPGRVVLQIGTSVRPSSPPLE